LSTNLKTFLFEEESFKSSFLDVTRVRLAFYYDVFTDKIFYWIRSHELYALGVVAASSILFFPRLIKKAGVKILILLLGSMMIGLLFFQGNFGNIYDYYLTGYYLVFILLFAVVLGSINKYKIGKLFVVIFFFLFLKLNFQVNTYKFSDTLESPHSIAFGNQKLALDWIYNDAANAPFSVDTYVPPVIPHAYDYLYRWYGGRVHGYEPTVEPIDPLYTLFEVDPPHPERLEEWLARQEGIGKVENEASFGGITVQRRKRY